jgi:hypothetical protein
LAAATPPARTRDGLGAVVKVIADGANDTQVNDGVSGYLAHSLIPFYFGLGCASTIDQFTVRWLSGQEQTIDGSQVKPNSLVMIHEEG